MQVNFKWVVAATLTAIFAAGTMAHAATDQEQWKNDVVGKSIVYVPVSGALTLTRIWGQRLKAQSEALGIKFTELDPDFNAQREEQMIASLIPKKPTVLIAHNPNVTVLAKVLERAQKAGIYVIQINMASKTPTDAYVGVDPIELGRRMGEAAVEACTSTGAPSHKIALMNGEVTSAYSLGIQQGLESVFKKNSDIKIVSDQAANWDPKAAHDKATVVLQANTDLCAYVGRWIGQDVGLVQAVKQAGLEGKVKIITTGGGEAPACEDIKAGSIYKSFSYQAAIQADQMMAVAQFLMQSGKPAGAFHVVLYSPIKELNQQTVQPSDCTPVH